MRKYADLIVMYRSSTSTPRKSTLAVAPLLLDTRSAALDRGLLLPCCTS
jgi:hypothetical protein